MKKKNTFLILLLCLGLNASFFMHADEDRITALKILVTGAGIASSGYMGYVGYNYLKNNNPKLVENSKTYLWASAKSTGSFLATLGACFFGYQSTTQIPKYLNMPAQNNLGRYGYGSGSTTSDILKQFSLMFIYPAAATTCGVLACKLAESARNDLKNLNK